MQDPPWSSPSYEEREAQSDDGGAGRARAGPGQASVVLWASEKRAWGLGRLRAGRPQQDSELGGCSCPEARGSCEPSSTALPRPAERLSPDRDQPAEGLAGVAWEGWAQGPPQGSGPRWEWAERPPSPAREKAQFWAPWSLGLRGQGAGSRQKL